MAFDDVFVFSSADFATGRRPAPHRAVGRGQGRVVSRAESAAVATRVCTKTSSRPRRRRMPCNSAICGVMKAVFAFAGVMVLWPVPVGAEVGAEVCCGMNEYISDGGMVKSCKRCPSGKWSAPHCGTDSSWGDDSTSCLDRTSWRCDAVIPQLPGSTTQIDKLTCNTGEALKHCWPTSWVRCAPLVRPQPQN